MNFAELKKALATRDTGSGHRSASSTSTMKKVVMALTMVLYLFALYMVLAKPIGALALKVNIPGYGSAGHVDARGVNIVTAVPFDADGTRTKTEEVLARGVETIALPVEVNAADTATVLADADAACTTETVVPASTIPVGPCCADRVVTVTVTTYVSYNDASSITTTEASLTEYTTVTIESGTKTIYTTAVHTITLTDGATTTPATGSISTNTSLVTVIVPLPPLSSHLTGTGTGTGTGAGTIITAGPSANGTFSIGWPTNPAATSSAAAGGGNGRNGRSTTKAFYCVVMAVAACGIAALF
ncbi:hypothetical protein VTK56DRAFT_9570 [Thermocarpiscus australiensis]